MGIFVKKDFHSPEKMIRHLHFLNITFIKIIGLRKRGIKYLKFCDCLKNP